MTGAAEEGEWFQPEPSPYIAWAVGKLLGLSFIVALLLYLVIVPPPEGIFPLDPRRIGAAGFAVLALLIVAFPLALAFVYEWKNRRRVGKIGVFHDRLEVIGRVGTRSRAKRASYPFERVRFLYAFHYGIHLKERSGARGISLWASSACRERALVAFKSWCEEHALTVEVRQYSKSPLPLFLPRSAVTEVEVREP